MTPTLNTIKRLFAGSGNRCAFPNCTAPLTHNDTLLGEICHIKGENPGSARYDQNQSSEQRRAYENLIILCPTHHTVIDDDVEAYTVGRLLRMKAEHQARSQAVPEADAERMASLFSMQNVSSVGQSGGLSAHTIHAHTVNVETNTHEPLALKRQMQAVEKLWQIVRCLRNEFGDIVSVDSILTRDELQSAFADDDWPGAFTGLHIYESQRTLLDKFARCGASEADVERPFISHRLWSVFYTIRALHGRMAYLFQQSFENRRYRDWREDSGADQLLGSILPSKTVEQIKVLTVFGLERALEHLELQFLAEAKMGTQ